MCTQSGRAINTVELADIFSLHADAYIASHGVSSSQHKAINAISRCRTAQLGGHVLRCNHCGVLEIAYNSCRYRHCPKCQAPKKVRWLSERKAELLPVPYFHVVFTLPHELNPIASYNQAVIYNLLFKAAWATVNTLGHDKKRLNGQMGMTSFLHTWSQQLNQHIHLHCMVPAGALCDIDGETQWRASKTPDYLFPVKVMAKLFGKLFLTELTEAFKNQELQFKGCIAKLTEESQFMKFKATLTTKTWNVYAKEPFNGAEGGMEYLARYFVKTAIGNERLVSFDEHQVRFKWRDSRDNDKIKIMALDTHEFIRRYLMHILPHGFMRVRYCGFLANAVKAKNIALIQSLLSTGKQHNVVSNAVLHHTFTLKMTATANAVLPVAPAMSNMQATDAAVEPLEINLLQRPILEIQGDTLSAQSIKKEAARESTAELMQRIVGIDVTLCKHCKVGHLEKVQMLYPTILYSPTPWDTS